MDVRELLAPLCAMALCAGAGNAAASTPKVLTGWGPFKFGMTFQQVLHASSAHMTPSGVAPPKLETMVRIGDYRTRATFLFGWHVDALMRITLSTAGISRCPEAFRYFRTHLTAKYGQPKSAKRSSDFDPSRDRTDYYWYFRNGYSIELTRVLGVCATVIYGRISKPLPKAGF